MRLGLMVKMSSGRKVVLGTHHDVSNFVYDHSKAMIQDRRVHRIHRVAWGKAWEEMNS